MIEFRKKLEDHLLAKLTTAVGTGSDPTKFVTTFDRRLRDVPIEQTPFLVVNVRRGSHDEGEIGNEHDLVTWECHVYYLDIDANYEAGELKRDHILSKVEKYFAKNRRLENFQVTDTSGEREYVYDVGITEVIFDSSGQEEYYSFVSELYVNVYTARN